MVFFIFIVAPFFGALLLYRTQLRCDRPSAILCRTNAGVVDHVIRALEDNKKVHVVGGNAEIVRLLQAVARLKEGYPVDLPEFFGFTDWSEVVDFSKCDEGASLRSLVRIVGQYGEVNLIRSLTKTNASEPDAELIISTAHKAKGRQWPRVLLNDDFAIDIHANNGKDCANASELRLLYVAMTRAQQELELPAVIVTSITEQTA